MTAEPTAENVVLQTRAQLVRDLLEEGLKLLYDPNLREYGDPQSLSGDDLVRLSAEVRGHIVRAVANHTQEPTAKIKKLEFDGEYRENKLKILKADKQKLRDQLRAERGKRTAKRQAVTDKTARLEASLELRTRELIDRQLIVDGLYTVVRYLAEQLGEAEREASL